MNSYQRLKHKLELQKTINYELMRSFRKYLQNPDSPESKEFYLNVILVMELPYGFTKLMDNLSKNNLNNLEWSWNKMDRS